MLLSFSILRLRCYDPSDCNIYAKQFGASDVKGGMVYGLFGAAITGWGLIFSWVNDALGIRNSLICRSHRKLSCVDYDCIVSVQRIVECHYASIQSALPLVYQCLPSE